MPRSGSLRKYVCETVKDNGFCEPKFEIPRLGIESHLGMVVQRVGSGRVDFVGNHSSMTMKRKNCL